MSIQQPQQRDRESDSYRRDNYYAGGDDYDDSLDPGGHDELTGTSKHRWVAKSVLRDGATLLDPLLLEDDREWYGDAVPIDAGSAMELGDAEHFIVADQAREGVAAYGHPKRCNETYGHLVGGGTIADRSLDDFMQCVDSWLQFLVISPKHRITDRERKAIREKAEWLKQHDTRQWHDVKIVEELSRAVDQSGEAITDYLRNKI